MRPDPCSISVPKPKQSRIEKDMHMSLEEKLAQIRAGAVKRIGEDKWALMGQATRDLRASGIMDAVIKEGDPLPAFALKNVDGIEVSAAHLLAKGTVVLTVFRGHW